MDRYIRQVDVSKEYPFSLTTIHRWRRAGLLTTFRQGKRRVVLLRSELNALLAAKEKVAVGSSDEESDNQFVAENDSRCKDTTFSSRAQIITVNNCLYDEDDETNAKE